MYIYLGVSMCDDIELEISEDKASYYTTLTEEEFNKLADDIESVKARLKYLKENG